MHLIAGQQFRAGIGLTTVLPDIDFETYSEAGLVWNLEEGKWTPLPGLGGQQRGLKGCGTRNYVEHPTFRVLSLAWDLKDGKGKRWWRPPELADLFPAQRQQPPPGASWGDLEELFSYIRADGLMEAWKSDFEYQVWEFHCVPKLGWPRLRLEQMRCAQAKSKASGYPAALDNAGDVLELPAHLKKDPKGKALITKLTMPRKPTKGNPALRWTPATAPKDFADFYAYNVQDIVTEEAASLKLPDLTPHELNVWLMDQRINVRGMQIDGGAVEDSIAILEQCREREHAKLRTLTGGRVQTASKVAEMLRWMASRGVHLSELDEETVEEALKRTDYPQDVLQVLRIRQVLAFGSVNKLYKFRSQATPAGRLHDQYSYHGAHTSLWNSQNVQVANLYKGIFDKPEKAALAREAIRTRCLEFVEYTFPGVDALEIIASYLRSLIIAAPGHRLISADFTAIQAVVTSALAGEEWRLEVFRTHGNIYLAMAARMTGNTIESYLAYRELWKKHHDDRQLGKLATLSGDFGAWIGGWKRFGADKYGDDAWIKRTILANRQAQPAIVELWGGQTRNKFNKAQDGSYAPERQEFYGLEGAAIQAVRAQRDDGQPGEAFGYRGVQYQMFEDCLYCTLPSGGFIRYHAPRLERSDREYASPWELALTYEGWNSSAGKGRQGWARMKLYGGVLTQNAVSHEAREVQAYTMLALERGGYPIVMHTHDENVAEVLKGRGSVAEYMHIIRSTLAGLQWAYTPDGKPWPIKIPDAWECETYGKWED